MPADCRAFVDILGSVAPVNPLEGVLVWNHRPNHQLHFGVDTIAAVPEEAKGGWRPVRRN